MKRFFLIFLIPNITLAAGLLFVIDRRLSDADQQALIIHEKAIANESQYLNKESLPIYTNQTTHIQVRTLNFQSNQADSYGINASNQNAWVQANLDNPEYVTAYDTDDPSGKLNELGLQPINQGGEE